MFTGFTEQTIGFLWGLRLNNYKSWFEEHRSDYNTYVYKPIREFAAEIQERFVNKYPELMLSVKISRINRDARRLFGRGPYRDHLWISIYRQSEEHVDRPSFWFGIHPETLSYGLGFWMPSADTMAKHRARIDNNPERLLALAEALDEQGDFLLDGDYYKRSKGGPDGLLAEWYNLKSIAIDHTEPIGPQIESAELADRVIAGLEFLLPYYDYFFSLASDPEPVSGMKKGTDKTR